MIPPPGLFQEVGAFRYRDEDMALVVISGRPGALSG